MGSKVYSEFLFRPTQASDIDDLALMAAKVTPNDCADPDQLLFTAINKNGVVIAFLRFHTGQSQAVWSEFVYNPNFLKTDFKLAVLAQVKEAAAHFKKSDVVTATGLIVGAWKSFVKEQAVSLGYRVEDVPPEGSKSLVLRF